MKYYRLEQYLGNVVNINESALELFRELGLKYGFINCTVTREAYNDSDFTAWVLVYGKFKEKEMKQDLSILLNLKVDDKPVFSVCSNGFGTGLSVTSNIV